jgi:hypothetical protein
MLPQSITTAGAVGGSFSVLWYSKEGGPGDHMKTGLSFLVTHHILTRDRLQKNQKSMTSVLFVYESIEVPIRRDVLTVASRVWRSLLDDEETQSPQTPSPQQPRSLETVDPTAFREVLQWFTMDRDDEELEVSVVVKALPLVHKYDCPGVLKWLREEDRRDFVDKVDGVPTIRSLTTLEYIVKKQELWGPEELNENMLIVLSRTVLFHSYPTDRDDRDDDDIYVDPHRITAETYVALLPYIRTIATSSHHYSNSRKRADHSFIRVRSSFA